MVNIWKFSQSHENKMNRNRNNYSDVIVGKIILHIIVVSIS